MVYDIMIFVLFVYYNHIIVFVYLYLYVIVYKLNNSTTLPESNKIVNCSFWLIHLLILPLLSSNVNS